MSPSIIRLSRGASWGTAFAVTESDSVVFHTAKHVLADLGFTDVHQIRPIDMCDESNAYLMGPAPYELRVISLDAGCDTATFDCSFPAHPFLRSSHSVQVGDEMRADGYLPIDEKGLPPDCGEITTYRGPVESVGCATACDRSRFRISLKTPVLDLYGMSGGPVVHLAHPTEVVALLNGGPHDSAGGPPFLATQI